MAFNRCRGPPFVKTPNEAGLIYEAPAGTGFICTRRYRLHPELARLKDQIRENERIWSGFRQIEIKMIGAHSLYELVAILVNGIPRKFPGVDRVTLAYFDPEYEMARLLDQNDAQTNADGDQGGQKGVLIRPRLEPSSFISISRETLITLFPSPWKPQLGVYGPQIQSLLFPDQHKPLGSMALAPLVLRGELIGCLNQGSFDSAHFQPGTATDLLDHLAAVTALCLDNAVSHERLKLDGLTDPLTGVANRRFFERRLADEVERWSRRKEPLACMLADIDHFKRVNDQFGHQVGDRALQQVAGLLGEDLRGVDVLARYGGEEFVLLLPNTNVQQAEAIAERLRTKIAGQPFSGPEERPLDITVSIGLACLGPDIKLDDVQPGLWLFQQADAALYQAKQSGRNRVIARIEG